MIRSHQFSVHRAQRSARLDTKSSDITRGGTRRSGFTLIELLVVIAIISILASMLFPAFSKAREQARKVVCISNLKQIGLGIQMYNQDYDEMFPVGYPFWDPASDIKDPAKRPLTLVGVLDPQIKSDPVWRCPSWSGAYSGGYNAGNYSFVTDSGNNVIGVPNVLQPYSLAALGRATEYPLLFCGIAPAQDASGIGKMNAHAGFVDNGWKNNGETGGTTILFGDGHAKYQVMGYSKWEQLYTTSRGG